MQYLSPFHLEFNISKEKQVLKRKQKPALYIYDKKTFHKLLGNWMHGWNGMDVCVCVCVCFQPSWISEMFSSELWDWIQLF